MGEKVVIRKHFLFFCFFTNRHNSVRDVIEKVIRNQSFENNGMHIYLIYDQQFRNKGGKALTEEKKKRCTLQTWCQKTCKLIEKVDRPANSRDASPIATIWSIWRDNILQRSTPPKHRRSWDSFHDSPRKNVTLDILWELYSITHSLENIRKHKVEHSGHLYFSSSISNE